METILFYIFGGSAVLAALLMITRINPLMSALWLIASLASSAGIFALLAAPLLAVLQILVYAGAVMVLFIFVVMLIDLGPSGLKARAVRFGKVLGAVAVVYFIFVVALALWRPPLVALSGEAPVDFSPTSLGNLLLTKFAVPFELASVLLLAAIVGAVVMGKKRL